MVRYLFILFLIACGLINAQGLRPKNIIILIGDGMGTNIVGASILKNDNSPFKEFKCIGLSFTCSADKLITDSAAAATAIATGYLTNNKYVSVDALGQPLYTLFEHAQKLGLSTGLVVTSTVSHATPGAFVAHCNDRNNQDTIALQMVKGDLDVVIGGGLKYFLPPGLNGVRRDNKNLISDLSAKNYILPATYEDLKSLPDSSNKFYALLEPDALPDAANRNYALGDLTQKAINSLDNNCDGFILVVEGSKIDWAAHDNKTIELLSEMDDFVSAVKVALDFAKKDKNTLILVTADHETGGLSVINGNANSKDLEIGFTTKGHTPSPIPIFSFGPGAEMLNGIMKINEIGKNLFYLLDPAITF